MISQTPARKVTRHALSTDPKDGGHARWVINDGEDGIFDAVLVTIGSCGPAKKASFPNQDAFRGPVVHSSGLDDAELADRKVVIVGSGASGVEAAELAILKGAKDVVLLARSDKWCGCSFLHLLDCGCADPLSAQDYPSRHPFRHRPLLAAFRQGNASELHSRVVRLDLATEGAPVLTPDSPRLLRTFCETSVSSPPHRLRS